ncbi:mucosa-associated lymphoid tissue lymphoma translocation protein 1-like [Mytilus trossulus]|uniref:mucosa-associated lymphoid tissue lymphoma translocation protein 1-like n=1 Tax=Mytilus trossulus TaxID=6551 RepID=UPI00300517C3
MKMRRNGLTLEQCRNLKGVHPDTNIVELKFAITLNICTTLDGNPKTCNWKEFLAKASELKSIYNVSTIDVNHFSRSNSPSETMLWRLGSYGMVAFELVHLLDQLRLESLLMDIKEYEPIVITKQPPSHKTINEGTALHLHVEGKGFPYPRYQWFKNVGGEWEKLRAETNNIFKIVIARQPDNGTYCCRLHNGNQRHTVLFTSRTSVSVTPPIEEEKDVILYDVSSFREGQENTESTDTSAKKFMPEGSRFEPKAKVALIIGNADYLADKPLFNVPQADVELMKSTFEGLGFRVFSYLDLTKAEMKSTIDWFIDVVKQIGKDVYIVFCFFGHGFEESRKCHLVPTDAVHGYTTNDCVCADDVLYKCQRHIDPALLVMVLDTCRIRNSNENPNRQIAKSQAFDSLNEPATNGNTVVLYSTSRGMSAYQNNQNGLLAKYFNQRIKQKTDVTSVMQNVLEDLGKEMKKYKENQTPQFTSTLNEPRSFADIIRPCIETTKVYDHIDGVFSPPPSREVFVPGANIKLSMECQADTLNMMTMYINTRIIKECDTILLDDIDIAVENFSSNFKIKSVSMVSGRGKFEIKNIQKLQDDMLLKIIVWNKKANDLIGDVDISLGKPLISKLVIRRDKLS